MSPPNDWRPAPGAPPGATTPPVVKVERGVVKMERAVYDFRRGPSSALDLLVSGLLGAPTTAQAAQAARQPGQPRQPATTNDLATKAQALANDLFKAPPPALALDPQSGGLVRTTSALSASEAGSGPPGSGGPGAGALVPTSPPQGAPQLHRTFSDLVPWQSGESPVAEAAEAEAAPPEEAKRPTPPRARAPRAAAPKRARNKRAARASSPAVVAPRAERTERQRELLAAFRWEVAQALKMALAAYNKGFRGGTAVHTFLHDYSQQLPLGLLQEVVVWYASPVQQRIHWVRLAMERADLPETLRAGILARTGLLDGRRSCRNQLDTTEAVGALFVKQRQLCLTLPSVISSDWADFGTYWCTAAPFVGEGPADPTLTKKIADAEAALTVARVHEILDLPPPVCEDEDYFMEILVRRFEWKGRRTRYESSANVGVMQVCKDTSLADFVEEIVPAFPKIFPVASTRGFPRIVITDERLRTAQGAVRRQDPGARAKALGAAPAGCTVYANPANVVRLYLNLRGDRVLEAGTAVPPRSARVVRTSTPRHAICGLAEHSSQTFLGSQFGRGNLGATLAAVLDRGGADLGRVVRTHWRYGPEDLATVVEAGPGDLDWAGDRGVLLRHILPRPEDLNPATRDHVEAYRRRATPSLNFPDVTCKLAFSEGTAQFDLQWLSRRRAEPGKQFTTLKKTHTRPRHYS